MQESTARFLKNFGQWMFATGALLLAFLAFQLWGTGLVEDSAQGQLEKDFAELSEVFETVSSADADASNDSGELDSDGVSVSGDSAGASNPTQDGSTQSRVAPSLDPEQLPAVGEPVGLIRIPTIGLDKVIVEGVGLDELREGPGHYSGSPLPGQEGNAAIAGHRTTYGAPFGDLDLLKPGDLIEVETVQGTFEYEVLPQTSESGRELGHVIVAPSDTYVIEDYGDNRLTLTACHPKYTANERIVVHAALIAPDTRFSGTDTASAPLDPAVVEEFEPAPLNQEEALANDGEDAPPAALANTALDDPFGWHTDEIPAVILWALICAAIVAASQAAAKRTKAMPTYMLASPLFLGALWVCFSHLDRLLPPL